MKLIKIIALALLFPHFLACAETANEETIKIEALHALGYAELIKTTVKRDCLHRPELEGNPLCQKFASIPNNVIEKFAQPYFNKHVSKESAQEIIRFYTTPEGQHIKKELINSIGTNSMPVLSQHEYDLLDEFNRSTAGKEAGLSANDREASVQVLHSLAAYDASLVEIKSSLDYENELGIKFSNCKTMQDTQLRVFHSMYRTRKEAELVYEEILKDKEQDKFTLLKQAAKGSIDRATTTSGGDLGFIEMGLFPKDVEYAIFQLPLKKLSPPVSSEFGWHLFWIDGARDNKTKMPCSQLP